MTLLLLLFSQVFFNLATARTATTNYNPCGQLYLTQSPRKTKNLQLNWHFTCKDPPDTIALTLGNLKLEDANAQILYKISPGSVVKGSHETSQPFRNVQLPGNWSENNDFPDLEAECFDYFIASLKNNEVIYSQCFSIQPTWMTNFGELRIGDMMIPGTHNSGAWRTSMPGFKNYVLNQDKNFWEQLVYGIRYFDIRIGYYDNGLFINHGIIKCTELIPELQSVANFLKKSPKEVVVLNFYRFPHPKYFSENKHLEILRIIRDIFGDLIYPYSRYMHRQGPKLSDFWQKQQRVVISYRQDNLVRRKLL